LGGTGGAEKVVDALQQDLSLSATARGFPDTTKGGSTPRRALTTFAQLGRKLSTLLLCGEEIENPLMNEEGFPSCDWTISTASVEEVTESASSSKKTGFSYGSRSTSRKFGSAFCLDVDGLTLSNHGIEDIAVPQMAGCALECVAVIPITRSRYRHDNELEIQVMAIKTEDEAHTLALNCKWHIIVDALIVTSIAAASCKMLKAAIHTHSVITFSVQIVEKVASVMTMAAYIMRQHALKMIKIGAP